MKTCPEMSITGCALEMGGEKRQVLRHRNRAQKREEGAKCRMDASVGRAGAYLEFPKEDRPSYLLLRNTLEESRNIRTEYFTFSSFSVII